MVAELRVMSLTLRGPTGALGGPVEQNRQSSVEIHMNRITGKPDPKFLDRYAWAVKTQIRLLLQERSGLGLHNSSSVCIFLENNSMVKPLCLSLRVITVNYKILEIFKHFGLHVMHVQELFKLLSNQLKLEMLLCNACVSYGHP